MKRIFGTIALSALAATSLDAQEAAPLQSVTPDSDQVAMYKVDQQGIGKYIGTVEVTQSDYGLVFTPFLSQLPPGLHGIHVHENPSCEPNTKDREHNIIPAGKAGAHFDPRSVDEHGSPWEVGHSGDLPNLFVDKNGNAEQPFLAPGLQWEFLNGRSLLIHESRDTYRNTPNGGSGLAIACGVFFSGAVNSAMGSAALRDRERTSNNEKGEPATTQEERNAIERER